MLSCQLTLPHLVVSTEKLILWRSKIFGGISNEISVLLDQSTLPREMKGMSFVWEILRTIGRVLRTFWGLGDQ
jgi:hypothetical protein